ncbi:MAG: polymer-forming cytoskeletal protein [Rhodospirillales bacterium]|nr:polymer-forming cytoskeletal protein [Rhodospirillales bacterium]
MFFKNSATPQVCAGSVTGAKCAIPSLLSSDIRIRGDVSSDGEIQVDGIVDGDIVARCLVVSEAGSVSGTIVAASVRVLGTVNGSITAGSIRLARTARVTGDVVHEALSIEEGAFMLGHCGRAEPDRPILDDVVDVSGCDEASAEPAGSPADEALGLADADPDDDPLTIPPLAR